MATIRLRPWQKMALDVLESRTEPDTLICATPGAGKSLFGVVAVMRHLKANPGRRVIVVAPTDHLRRQWVGAASRVGLHLTGMWSPSTRWPRQFAGVVTTYQQVAANPENFRRVSGDAAVILDELHHGADGGKTWGLAVRRAFELAPFRLALSGTPFRTDDNEIPFVTYVEDSMGERVSRPDFTYGYSDALADGRVVRLVKFPRVGGEMEWLNSKGRVRSASFEDCISKADESGRLRAAISLDGEWLPDVLCRSNERLMSIRRHDPDAGGLVLALDQDHAKGIARMLRDRVGVRAVVATSDDPDASDIITAFAKSTEPWIVAVRMISEGVDVPRLRVAVHASTVVTDLSFRQAVGRIVRWSAPPGVRRSQHVAYYFVPDDPRLRRLVSRFTEERNHIVPPRSDETENEEDPADNDGPGDDKQPSLFEVLSSKATEVSHDPDVQPEAEAVHNFTDDDLVLDLFHLAPTADGAPEVGGETRDDQMKALRTRNAALAKRLARVTGLEHADVNRRLNKLVGVAKVAEATMEQLAGREAKALDWLDEFGER